jgi:hypothetical protein
MPKTLRLFDFYAIRQNRIGPETYQTVAVPESMPTLG